MQKWIVHVLYIANNATNLHHLTSHSTPCCPTT